jgi:hypothetical protein
MRKENTHMDHFEDRIVLETKNPLAWINDILNDNVTISRKWDGAPSIFVGRDLEGVYIAKKGIFNKEPKIYHTCKQIDDGQIGVELTSKFKEVLDIMQNADLEIGDLVQGDLLFTMGDVKYSTYGNQQFQANTIVYETQEDIFSYRCGIVWHTKYVNNTALFGQDVVSMVGDLPELWHFNATEDIDPIDNSTKVLLEDMMNEYNIAKEDFTLDQKTIDLWVCYINYTIKEGQFDHESNIDGFSEFVEGHLQRKVDEVKREVTKQKRIDEYAPVFRDLPMMVSVSKLHSLLYKMKLVILERLNKSSSIDTYLKTTTGLIPTGHEGYVVINKYGYDAVKIVDREEFSKANFSDDVIKGWN